MNKHTRTGTSLGVALLLAGSLVFAGCTSKPDEAEMKQLNDLKAEVASLQKEIASKEQAKAALEKEVAEKNAKLKKCADDQAVVKQRLANK
jgi:septal ring factor EnvC (AmiA/AmiB activator)